MKNIIAGIFSLKRDFRMKTVLITGSSRGIGLGLAREFLIRNCAVVISARGREKLEQAVENLGREFGADRVMGKVCDMTDYAQVEALWTAATDQFGKVDFWINNAGISNRKRMLWELEPGEIKSVVDTNIIGLLYGCKVAIKGMLKQGEGQVFNFTGHGSNDMVLAGLLPYGTSKRAVRYLTDALEVELEGKPVLVGTIGPGMVITDLIKNDFSNMTDEDRAQARIIFNILGDKVETVTPFLAEKVLENTKQGAKIDWLTDEIAQKRFADDQYLERDLLSEFGI